MQQFKERVLLDWPRGGYLLACRTVLSAGLMQDTSACRRGCLVFGDAVITIRFKNHPQRKVLGAFPGPGWYAFLATIFDVTVNHMNKMTLSNITELSACTTDLRPSMGDPKSDFIVTMHCVVRPAGSSKSSGKANQNLVSQVFQVIIPLLLTSC